MTKYSQQQIIEACELREQGMSYRRIGMIVGMHPASVLEYCQAHGAIPPKVPKVQKARSFTPELDAEILRRRAAGARLFEISREVGRDSDSIRKRLRAVAFNEAKAEAGATGEAA